MYKVLFSVCVVAALGGCATAKLGDEASQAQLRKFEPVSDKVSVYVCRQDSLSAGGIGAEAFVNGKSVGALKSNTFAHTALPPGDVSVFLRRNGLGINSGDSGVLRMQGRSGEVLIIWAGAAPFSPLTVDHFATAAEGKACVAKAAYAVP